MLPSYTRTRAAFTWNPTPRPLNLAPWEDLKRCYCCRLRLPEVASLGAVPAASFVCVYSFFLLFCVFVGEGLFVSFLGWFWWTVSPFVVCSLVVLLLLATSLPPSSIFFSLCLLVWFVLGIRLCLLFIVPSLFLSISLRIFFTWLLCLGYFCLGFLSQVVVLH